MKEEMFNDLIASVKEAGQMRRDMKKKKRRVPQPVMTMVTEEQVEQCTKRNALALSIRHHEELSTCTQTDIKENYGTDDFLVGWYCGLCTHYFKKKAPLYRTCVECPLYKVQEMGCGGGSMYEDGLPNTVWQDCYSAYHVWKEAFNHRDRQKAFRDFQDCEKRMVMLLKQCVPKKKKRKVTLLSRLVGDINKRIYKQFGAAE